MSECIMNELINEYRLKKSEMEQYADIYLLLNLFISK